MQQNGEIHKEDNLQTVAVVMKERNCIENLFTLMPFN